MNEYLENQSRSPLPQEPQGTREAQQAIRRVSAEGQPLGPSRRTEQATQEESSTGGGSIISWKKAALVLGSAGGAGFLTYWIS